MRLQRDRWTRIFEAGEWVRGIDCQGNEAKRFGNGMRVRGIKSAGGEGSRGGRTQNMALLRSLKLLGRVRATKMSHLRCCGSRTCLRLKLLSPLVSYDKTGRQERGKGCESIQRFLGDLCVWTIQCPQIANLRHSRAPLCATISTPTF